MQLDVRPLAPALLDDWLAFFDKDAFCDNPDWATCYCRCYVFGGGGMEAWDAACSTSGENRRVMIERIRAGTVDGMLAYRDGRVAGWIHYGPTERFETPVGRLQPIEPGVASVACFVVAPQERRRGVARALLRAACDEMARRGFKAVDARVPVEPKPGAMHLFCGPLPLYLGEGFEEVEADAKRRRLRRTLSPK
jgi:GNAT superfamily N-acetyltransferase